MARCRKCGIEIFPGERICLECKKKYMEMCKIVWAYSERRHGKMSRENLELFKQDRRRLERLWKRDPEKFRAETTPNCAQPK